jgi:hypothetical protein
LLTTFTQPAAAAAAAVSSTALTAAVEAKLHAGRAHACAAVSPAD